LSTRSELEQKNKLLGKQKVPANMWLSSPKKLKKKKFNKKNQNPKNLNVQKEEFKKIDRCFNCGK